MSAGVMGNIAQELRRISRKNSNRAPGESRADILALAQKAERLAGQMKNARDLRALAALCVGEILLASDDPAQADKALLRAESALGPQNKGNLPVLIAAQRAQALALLDRWDELEKVAANGIKQAECHRYKALGPFLQASYLKSRFTLYGLGATAALRRKDVDTALKRCELAKARSMLADVSKSEDAVDSSLEDLLKRFASVNQGLQSANSQDSQTATTELRAERQALWDLLMTKRRRRRLSTLQQQEFTRQRLQEMLHPDEATLYLFWLEPRKLMQVVFDRRRIWFDMLTVDEAEAADLDCEVERILSAGADGQGVPFDLLDDVVKFDRLLWPAHAEAQSILANAGRVVISSHRKLHALPLHALKCGERFLIENHAFRYVPNLTCLVQQAPIQPDRNVATIGVCNYNVPGVVLPPLEEAEREAEEVAAIYRSTGHSARMLLGAQANEEALRHISTTDLGCLHIACHGLNIDAQSPMEACLYLCDGKLDGIELPLLDLAAPLVVLTACSSGQRWLYGRHLDQIPGDDLMGLQAAFFAAGTREIVSTLCPVDDLSAREIGVGFHRHRLKGMASDLALQSALKDFLCEPENLPRGYWAPFELIATAL